MDAHNAQQQTSNSKRTELEKHLLNRRFSDSVLMLLLVCCRSLAVCLCYLSLVLALDSRINEYTCLVMAMCGVVHER